MAVVALFNLLIVSPVTAWLLVTLNGFGVATAAAIVGAWIVFFIAYIGYQWRSRLQEISREEEEARRGGDAPRA